VAHAYNSCYHETENGKTTVQDQPKQKNSLRPDLTEKSWVWWCVSVIPASVGSIHRRTKVQARPGKKQVPISKITRVKRAGGIAQVVQCLPSQCETLSSNPNNIKNK
jgi:hypothetical protein